MFTFSNLMQSLEQTPGNYNIEAYLFQVTLHAYTHATIITIGDTISGIG